MLTYVAAIITLLAAIGIWKVDLLKDSIMWFFVSAMAMMMHCATAGNTTNVFRKILTDAVKIVIVLEFLVNTCTFSLPVELILVPSLIFIILIDVVASMNAENAIVAKLFNGIQVIAGFVILGIAIRRAVFDFQNLKSLGTFRSIAIAPLLSVLMFPFIYIMLVMTLYEQVFMRLKFGPEKPPRLKRYARRRIMTHVGFRLNRLQYLLSNHPADLMHVMVESDIDRVLDQARNAGAPTAARCQRLDQ